MKKDERKALAFIGSITILIVYFAVKYGMR